MGNLQPITRNASIVVGKKVVLYKNDFVFEICINFFNDPIRLSFVKHALNAESVELIVFSRHSDANLYIKYGKKCLLEYSIIFNKDDPRSLVSRPHFLELTWRLSLNVYF